jgi:hypothetical protein
VWRPLIAPVVTCREWGAVTTFFPLLAGLPLDPAGWEQTPLVVRQAVVQLLAVIQQQEARITALDTRLSQRSRNSDLQSKIGLPTMRAFICRPSRLRSHACSCGS